MFQCLIFWCNIKYQPEIDAIHRFHSLLYFDLSSVEFRVSSLHCEIKESEIKKIKKKEEN